MIDKLQTGGSERQFATLAQGLSRDSFRLELGCIKHAGPFLEGLDEVKEFPFDGGFFNMQAYRACRSLGRHLHARGVVVAHSFDFYTNLMLIPVARLAEVPVVIGSQRQLGDLLSPSKQTAQNLAFQMCDRVICNSRAAAERLRYQGLPEHKLVIISNGLNEEAFAEVGPALPRRPDVLRVGMIARMNSPYKDQACFLRAAAQLVHRFPTVEFLLVGDGPLKAALERMSLDLGISHNVRFLGERRDIPAVLAAMDISVVTSRSESLSNVILESMAAAKPVVATRVGGNAELVRDGETGLLVEPGDAGSLAKALDFLLSQPAFRLDWGQRARGLAKANFSKRRMSEQHEQLYASLLEEKKWYARNKTSVPFAVSEPSPRLRVAMVAPSMRMVGGQAVQADSLERHWRNDSVVSLSFIPVNPEFPRWLGRAEKIPYVRTLFRIPLYLADLWRGTTDADIVHIFSASYWSFLLASVPAWLVARLRGKKTLINYHSGQAPDHLKRWRTALPVLRRTDRIVVPSEYLANVFRGYGLQARIVPNMVDLNQFSYRAREPLRPHLVCTRGFEFYYGVDLVIRAFGRVKEEFPDARLCLVGKGTLESSIHSLVNDLKLVDVEFTGPVAHQQIGHFYDQADIFINASWLDNMPISVLEAFASGTPVVSTAPGGIRYLVEHERTGLLCAPGDWKSLAANVIRLLRNPNLSFRLAQNAHAESRRYRWEAVRTQWLDVYHSLYFGYRTEGKKDSARRIVRAMQAEGLDAKESVGREDPTLSTRDIVCFANDWSSDPLSKKQIMLRLARRHRVLWINSINNRRPRLAQKDFLRTFQKLRDFTRGLTHVEDRIWVLSPLYIPFHGRPVVRTLNRWLLRWQIRRAMRQLQFSEAITWTFVPSSADVVRTLGEKLVIYQCVDEYSEFSDAAPEIRRLEQELLAKSDLVLVCSAALLEAKQKRNPQTYLVTHGVDYEHFSLASDDATPVAPELRGLPRPILGFHGLLADWVDLELIAELARKRPDWSVVLVGRADTDLTCIRGLSNVYVLGHRPYSRLSEYLRGFDVAILPFVCNELTRNANPLKLREYLAAGLPVVSAPLPEVARFKELVSLASTADEYINKINILLEQKLIGSSRGRSEKMIAESWDNKVAEMERLVASVAERPGLEQQIREHPLMQDSEIEFVQRTVSRHSEFFEYRCRRSGQETTLLLKHINNVASVAEAEEKVRLEYRALEHLRKHADSKLLPTIPSPLFVLPQASAILFEKLPGTRLSTILQRKANRLVGRLSREKLCAIADQVGHWLRQFHEATRHTPIRHESRLYLAQLSYQLDRCTSAGLDEAATQGIWDRASQVSRRLDRQPVAAAARHGDFVPQNILFNRDGLVVVDFENFCELDVVYEDIGTFTAYLTMLRAFPYYSTGTLSAMTSRFVSAYGSCVSKEVLNLYTLKASVTVLAESKPARNFLGYDRQLQARKHLINCFVPLLEETNNCIQEVASS